MYPAKLIQDGKLIKDEMPERDRYMRLIRLSPMHYVTGENTSGKKVSNKQRYVDLAMPWFRQMVIYLVTGILVLLIAIAT